MEYGESTFLEAHHSILREELARLEGQRIDMSLRMAHLMPPKVMENYDFSFLAVSRLECVDTPEFMNRKEIVHFLAPPGQASLAGDRVTAPRSGQPYAWAATFSSTITSSAANPPCFRALPAAWLSCWRSPWATWSPTRHSSLVTPLST